MAPQHLSRPSTLRVSAFALAALSLTPLSAPSAAQTVYREYEDGTVEALPDDGDDRELSAAPLRRPPPRAYDEEEDERFERDDDDDIDDDDDFDDDQDGGDRQGILDLAPGRSGANRPALDRKAPAPPPSVDAKPAEDAWKPAL